MLSKLYEPNIKTTLKQEENSDSLVCILFYKIADKCSVLMVCY